MKPLRDVTIKFRSENVFINENSFMTLQRAYTLGSRL